MVLNIEDPITIHTASEKDKPVILEDSEGRRIAIAPRLVEDETEKAETPDMEKITGAPLTKAPSVPITETRGNKYSHMTLRQAALAAKTKEDFINDVIRGNSRRVREIEKHTPKDKDGYPTEGWISTAVRYWDQVREPKTERPEDELVVSARWMGGKTGKELMPVSGKYDSEPTIWHNFESDEEAKKLASRLKQRGYIDVKIGKRKDVVKPKPKAPVSKEYGKLKVGQQIEVETPKGFVKGEITGFRSGDVGEDFMRVDVKTAERPYIGAHPNSIRVPEKPLTIADEKPTDTRHIYKTLSGTWETSVWRDSKLLGMRPSTKEEIPTEEAEIKKEIKEEKQGAKEYKEKAKEAETPQERKTYEGMAKDEERHAKQLASMEKPKPVIPRVIPKVKPKPKVIKTSTGAYQVILIDKSGSVEGESVPMSLQKAQASLAKLKGTEYNRSKVRPARRSLAARLIRGY